MYYKVARLPIGYAPPPERDNVVTVPPLVFPTRPIKLPHSGGGEEKMTDSFLTRCHMRAPARTIIRSSSIPPPLRPFCRDLHWVASDAATDRALNPVLDRERWPSPVAFPVHAEESSGRSLASAFLGAGGHGVVAAGVVVVADRCGR